MYNYYANIDNSATSGNGSYNYPFNWTNLKNFLGFTTTITYNPGVSSINNNDYIYIKGTYSNTFAFLNIFNIPSSVYEFRLIGWDPANNGNWKLIPTGPYNSTIITNTGVSIINENTLITIQNGDFYNLDIMPYHESALVINYGTLPNHLNVKFENCNFSGNTNYYGYTSTASPDIFNYCNFYNGNFYNEDATYARSNPNPPYDLTRNITSATTIFNYCNFGQTKLYLTDISAVTANDIQTFNYCTFSGVSTQSADVIIYNPSYDTVYLNNCVFFSIPAIIKYLNVNNIYSATSGDGTSSLPFNPTQLSNYITNSTIGSDLLIYVRGYNKTTSFIGFFLWNHASVNIKSITLNAWNSELLGMGVLDNSLYSLYIYENYPVTFNDIVLKNIYCYKSTYNSPVTFNNVIFYNSCFINCLNPIPYINFNGCTFINLTLSMNALYGKVYIKDCVFYNSTINDNNKSITNLDFDYCVFSGTSATVFANVTTPSPAKQINNCTFSWIPSATMPEISAISFMTPEATNWNPNKGNLAFENFGIDYTFFIRKPFWLINTGVSAVDSTVWLVAGASSNIFGDFRNGLYNSYRRGPGAFYFPNNTFYVDLSANNTSGVGTSAKPMPANIFSATNYLSNNDNIKLRGTFINNSNRIINFYGASGINIDAWDVSAYGPWKIINQNESTMGFYYTEYLNIKNGIMYTSNDGSIGGRTISMNIPAYSIENCYIVLSGTIPDYTPKLWFNNLGYGTYTVNIKGCTIISTNSSWLVNLNRGEIENSYGAIALKVSDSVFDVPSFSAYYARYYKEDLSAVFNNCVFKSIDKETLKGNNILYSENIIDSNCQYNWNPSVWPNFITDNIKEHYSFSALTSGTHGITISGSSLW